MNCPKCDCSERVKSGKIKERQRCKCKSCGCNYTVNIKSTAKPKSQKKQALHLYLEGLGFRSIGRFLGASNVSVLNRIRDFGKKVQELHADSQQIEMIEVDRMHSCIGSKKLLLDLDCC
jgi:transposase-like protein